MHDRYIHRAKQENLKSRAAWKLIEIDDKFSLIRKNQSIIDLGCYPGGWSQVAIERSSAFTEKKSKVIGVDLNQIQGIPNLIFLQLSVDSPLLIPQIRELLNESSVDLVLSDLSPSCTGIKQEDHLASTNLTTLSAQLAEDLLKLGGAAVLKTFMGSQTENLKINLKTRFEKVRSFKPRASRKNSPEIYFICENFIGNVY